MIGFLSATPARTRPTRESISARTLALDPDLKVGSQGFAAASVLVAGHAVGHNIDRIARLTGVEREGVARMARRLVDNGVWSSGNTVSHWCDNPADLASFRRDVAVAEGRLCRRMDEAGRLEWAPQGYWRKDFEYSGPRADTAAHAVRYHPHVAVPEHECLFVPDDALEEDEVTGADDGSTAAGQDSGSLGGSRADDGSTLSVDAPVWLGGETCAEPSERSDDWTEGLPDALGGEGSGAVWLGWGDAVPQPVSD